MRTFICLATTLLVLARASSAETLRVTSWNFVSSTNSGQVRLQEAAAALKKLDPDVILLEQVPDWQTCNRLAQALKPATYTVLACSSFRSPQTGASSKRQVAILSKQKAYFSWSQAWQTDKGTLAPGGFAFAALQVGKQRLGFFSVQLASQLSPMAAKKSPAARAAAARQWLQAVDSFRDWVTNRIAAAVVAGGFSATPMGNPPTSEEESFLNTFLGAALYQPVTLPASAGPDAGEAFPASLVPNPDNLPGIVLSRSPATCNLELQFGNLAGKDQPAAETAAAATEKAPAPPQQAVAAEKQKKDRDQTPLESRARASFTKEAAAAGTPSKSLAAAELPSALLPAARPAASTPPARSEAAATPFALGLRPYRPYGWAAALLAFIPLVWLLARRRAARRTGASALVPVRTGRDFPSAYTVVITPQSVTGTAENPGTLSAPTPLTRLDSPAGTQTRSKSWRASVPVSEAERAGLLRHLREWLKHKLVQKLMADRTELLHTQEAAALKLLAVDERLSKIELQLQQQNQTYEQRIAELSRQLLAAKEENREMIRARITQVKAEMEAARAKLAAQTARPEEDWSH